MSTVFWFILCHASFRTSSGEGERENLFDLKPRFVPLLTRLKKGRRDPSGREWC